MRRSLLCFVSLAALVAAQGEEETTDLVPESTLSSVLSEPSSLILPSEPEPTSSIEETQTGESSIPEPTSTAEASESGEITTSTIVEPTSSSIGDDDPSSVSISVTGTEEASDTPTSSSEETDVPPTATGIPTEGPIYTTREFVPISSYTFEPFALPSDIPQGQWVYPDTDPLDPIPVNVPLIPNFYPAWESAWEKAKAKVAGFTLEEKVNVTTGIGWSYGKCVGNIGGIEPVDGDGWPGLCLQDSPLGVRNVADVTAFPAGISIGATWNRRMMRERGKAMGEEFKGKGVNVALGPMMNLGRVAQGGRNFEGFSADPFLTGEGAYETIIGMQAAGVQACAKHLVNNEQEHKRTESSSEVDDRTQHELYMHPFLKSVMAGVASMMCSYNLINGTFACEDDKIMNDIVKREYAFRGYIMSDWQATMSTISAITGLDMTMPGDIVFNSGDSYFGGNLTNYVNNNTIPESRVDDMATRIIAAWYLLKQDEGYPDVTFDFFRLDGENNTYVDVQADHWKIVREVAAASTILLKNEGNTLPFKSGKDSLRNLAIIGNDAGPGRAGPNQFADQGGSDGVLAMGWGSGTANFTYLITPYEAIQERARREHTSVNWFFDNWDLNRAGNIAKNKDAALVFLNSDSGEQYITYDGNEGDKKNLTAWHNGDALVQAVAAQNPNTIVVVHSTTPLIVDDWVEHPNVTALIWAGLPGTEAGNAIADILYGDWNPSGKLPYTIAKSAEDYNAPLNMNGTSNDLSIIRIPYEEGLFIDYRHFDANGIEPRYEFGFGLSYTTFDYSDLDVKTIESEEYEQSWLEQAWAEGEASPIAEGSSTALWLHRPYYNVTFSVTNTGELFGGDIPQLYLHYPESADEPPSVLKGFNNVELDAGETKPVSIILSRYDASIWDVEAQGWRRPDGEVSFTIGRSSRDGVLDGTLP